VKRPTASEFLTPRCAGSDIISHTLDETESSIEANVLRLNKFAVFSGFSWCVWRFQNHTEMKTAAVIGIVTYHMIENSGVAMTVHPPLAFELEKSWLPRIVATAVVGRKIIVIAAIIFMELECWIKTIESEDVRMLNESVIELPTLLFKLLRRSFVERNSVCRYRSESRSC
jgi:hypothetical protein